MLKLEFYVPPNHKERVKEACFKAGAGRVGAYSQCAFEVEGTGQFCPLEGAHPYLGSQNHLERVREVRVEMVCQDRATMEATVEAMKRAHPYETVAYNVVKMENF